MGQLFSLKNKVAIVTGSEGGIGSAIYKGFNKAGAVVHGWDYKLGIDIANLSHIEALLAQISTVDILVNCAGITLPETALKYKWWDWDKTLLINLTIPLLLCQRVFPYMKDNGGSIINITSLWSELGFAGNPAYGASKGGLRQLTKCLAAEWADYNIRVNNVGLGYFKTNMTKRSWDNELIRNKIIQRIPMGRWGEPEDAVGACIFLASDASRYITGQDFYVDGGWLAKGL